MLQHGQYVLWSGYVLSCDGPDLLRSPVDGGSKRDQIDALPPDHRAYIQVSLACMESRGAALEVQRGMLIIA